MIGHDLLKPLIIFFAGVAFALLLLQILTKPEVFTILGKKSPAEIETQLKEEINKKEQETAKSITRTIIEKVLPAAAENPILSPVLEAKQDVEQTVNTIRNLPEEQKSAICRQVCNP